MIADALKKLVERIDLSREETAAAMRDIASGSATPGQIGAFLAALRTKGETVEELTGAAEVMRAQVDKVQVRQEIFVDTCGTGGDGQSTFNISTAAAFVVAGAGVTVAKHGNRSVSSRSGSADVLAALGVELELSKAAIEQCIEELGIGFLFAPRLHPAFKAAGTVRRELGVRTVFNLIGPLANPAGARRQVMGVFAPQLVPVLGQVLSRLGALHALVVHGDGLDEVSVTGETRVCEVRPAGVAERTLTPEELGLPRHPRASLAGGEPAHNARILRDIFEGQKGAARDAVLANAAAALVVLAARAIDSGAALDKLQRLVVRTRELAEP